MHVRKYLRKLVKDHLINVGDFGDQVSTNRLAVLSEAELPALVITTNDEDIDELTVHGSQEREMQLEITIHEKQLDDVDDKLDDHLANVERAMVGVLDLDVEAELTDLKLESVSANFDDATEQTTGLMTVTYTITYETQAGMPELEN